VPAIAAGANRRAYSALMKHTIHGAIAMAMLSLGACSSGGGGGMNAGTGGQGGDGKGGASGWDGHLIQGTSIALGAYALAVSAGDQLTFEPEPATDESDAWHYLLPEASYDVAINPAGGMASGHYRVTRKDDTLAFDISLDAANTGTAVSSSSESGWLSVGVRKPGATKFKMKVTCSGIMVSATGQAQALVEVRGEDKESGDPLFFCESAVNVPAAPSGEMTGGTQEMSTDEEGYTVFDYIRPMVTATAPGAGVAHAAVHLELQFVPQP